MSAKVRLENLIYGKEGAQEVLNTIDSVEGIGEGSPGASGK